MGRSFTPEKAGSPPRPEVIGWREARLLLAGFGPDAACRLASEEDIDLHALLELIDRGCPPELAMRILAPLDDPRVAG